MDTSPQTRPKPTQCGRGPNQHFIMTLPLSSPAIKVTLLAARSAARAEACGLVPFITALIVLTAAVQTSPPTQAEFQ
jgi:hypothetical protein